jgi:MSHA biogenesis protein MshQ
LIPAAGNKATISFDYYGYGGTGADGVAMILSNASIAPAAGAFGGSLGYAQKSNPGSDCTTTGGCVGFAGGWLGIGFDEFGNYQNPSEGRYGGPGFVANSVAIRGSGSGMAGYRFLVGTSTLSPTVNSAAALTPPDNYSVVVDHTDGIHAYTSVTRKTSGSSSYTTLLGCPPGVTSGCTVLDVKDPSYSQSAVPVNFNLSFTGSTGGSTNIHEIDNLNICTVQGLAVPTLHHIQVTHNGTACTGATNPAPVTIKACADAACSALYQNSVTVTLTSAPGGTWSPGSPITFTGGSTTVTLSDTTARLDTLVATATSPVASSATVYSPSNVLTFSACTFDVVEVGKTAYSPIYTKLANTLFSLDVLSLAGTQTPTAVTLVDASSGACSTYAALVNSSTTLAAISAGTPKTFNFTYANAAPNVRVRVTKAGPLYSCSSDNFAIRPANFTVTSPSAFPVKAGASFELDASSVIGYSGTALINSALVLEAHAGAVQVGSLGGVFSAASASDGISKGTTFTYSEVGNFRFKAWGVYDNGSFVDVDRSKVTPECFTDTNLASATLPFDPNVKDGNGMYGCYFGGSAASSYFGRFTPDHFDTTVTAPMTCTGLTFATACPNNNLVYSGQAFTGVTVTAKNASDAVTQNYEGATYAKDVTLSPSATSGGAAIATAAPGGTMSANAVLAAKFVKGTTAAAPATPIFTFAATPTVPTDVFVRATDTDGVTSFAKAHEGGVKVVSGRIKVSNAYGSNLLPLTLTVTAQYYNSALSWVVSSMDSVTSFAVSAIVPTIVTSPLTLGNLSEAVVGDTCANNVFCSGVKQFKLSNSANAAGSANISLNAPNYLLSGSNGAGVNPSISGQATFGVYKGNSNFIYMRESY